ALSLCCHGSSDLALFIFSFLSIAPVPTPTLLPYTTLFRSQLNISRHRLSDRLSTLVEMGVMKKVPYQERPVRYEYRLTDMGRDWYQVQLAIIAWGDKWLSDENGPPIEFLHKPCGHIFTPTVTCSECGEAVQARDVIPMAGPGLKANH